MKILIKNSLAFALTTFSFGAFAAHKPEPSTTSSTADLHASSSSTPDGDTRTLEQRQEDYDRKVQNYNAYIAAARATKTTLLIWDHLDWGPRPTK